MSDRSSIALRIMGSRTTLLGAQGSLQSINTNELDDGAFCYVASEHVHYELHRDSTAAHNPPVVIQPVAGPGRWTVATGGQGSQGAQGFQGATGVQGAQGTQGAGFQGAQGATGVQGSQGTQGAGFQGAQGSQGVQGSQGTQGSQGSQGTQGAGLQGAQGATGVQGSQGSQGTQGAGLQGAPGATGVQGSQGSQGTQGAGLQGAQGATGVQGSQGSQGTQGAGLQGAQGATGVQGSQGSQGTQGAGAQGSQGFQGGAGAQGSQGSQGAGLQGAQGATGVQGSQGSQGSQGAGAQGSQGAQGATGVQGSQGSQGAGLQGSQGATGVQGFQGVAGSGAQGAQGNQGAQGATGVQGSQGFQGATGAQGLQGFQGAAGAQGSQGFQGARGFQGFQGLQGLQGLQGTTGAQGSQGFQGFQGLQGLQGLQGTTGTQGSQGATGAQGLQGFQGAAGAQGSQGFQGARGFQGFQGLQGLQGLQGTTGAQGLQGLQGTTGAQGLQGLQGLQGTIGTQGSQGSQGATGTQGSQGSQGASGTLFNPLNQVYYVDATNAGTQTGSIAQPYVSPTAAFAARTTGNLTLLIAPGTYATALAIGGNRNITMIGLGEPGDQAVILGAITTTFTVTSAQTLTLQNLSCTTITDSSAISATIALIDAKATGTITGSGTASTNTTIRLSSTVAGARSNGMRVEAITSFYQIVAEDAYINGVVSAANVLTTEVAQNTFRSCTLVVASTIGAVTAYDTLFTAGFSTPSGATRNYYYNCQIDGSITQGGAGAGDTVVLFDCRYGTGASTSETLGAFAKLELHNVRFGPKGSGHINVNSALPPNLYMDAASEKSFWLAGFGRIAIGAGLGVWSSLDANALAAQTISDADLSTNASVASRYVLGLSVLTANRVLTLGVSSATNLQKYYVDNYGTGAFTLDVRVGATSLYTLTGAAPTPQRVEFQLTEDGLTIVYVGLENL